LGGKDLEKGLPDEQLLEVNIFARVTPKQKLDMVTVYQKRGDIVAMTGDGINDAPAIKKADVGIAMGLRGTPVAKETADVILKEDSFTAIVSAIEQGRAIFQNIKRFMVYLLSCNLSEILIVFVLGLFNASFTLMPLQILFLNLLTDIFPALALGMGKGNAQSMKQMPRKPGQAILSPKDWILVIVYAASITAAVLGTSWWTNVNLHWDPKVCNNIAFLSLAFAQLWHVFNLPSSKLSFWNNEVTRNAFVWWALLLCTFLLLLFYAFEPTRAIVGLQILPLKVWLVILGSSLVPVVIVFVLKRILKLFE
jgi:P-type Ca2+ transporter type 2C